MSDSIRPEVAQHRSSGHDIAAAFLNRWSPRAFSSEPVPPAELLRLFEAARWAPSGSNLQPWRFIVARTPEHKEAFLSFINESNAEWARKAPVLVLIASHKLTPSGGQSRSHAFDAGAAWGYLALQATHQNVAVHAMGGFDPDKARELLRVPADYELHAAVAIGYRGNADELSERNREREKPSTRRPLQDGLFEGSFGEPLRL